MAWDEQGNLRCGNEALYGCEHMKEQGSLAFTGMIARRRGWRIWGQDANCPTCAKPARISRTGSIDQEGLPGFENIPVVAKKSRKADKHIS